MTGQGLHGYRAEHTADLRIEAWAPCREDCVAEAVSALVASFAEVEAGMPRFPVECLVSAEDDDELLAAVFDEVIYLLHARGQVPVRTRVSAESTGRYRVRFGAVGIAAVTLTGPLPKALCHREMRLAPSDPGWRCVVSFDA